MGTFYFGRVWLMSTEGFQIAKPQLLFDYLLIWKLLINNRIDLPGGANRNSSRPFADIADQDQTARSHRS